MTRPQTDHERPVEHLHQSRIMSTHYAAISVLTAAERRQVDDLIVAAGRAHSNGHKAVARQHLATLRAIYDARIVEYPTVDEILSLL